MAERHYPSFSNPKKCACGLPMKGHPKRGGVPKKKERVYFALWNYDTLYCVEYYKHKCREFALTLTNEAEVKRMFRTKAFRISKVSVREV